MHDTRLDLQPARRSSARLRAPWARSAALGSVAVAALVLAGCSGSPEGTASTTTSAAAQASDAPSTGAADGQTGGQRGEGGRSGTSGLVASVTDGLMQVQGSDSQTAVSFDGATTVTQTVAGTAADVAVGSCVFVMGGAADDSSGEAAAATAVAVSEAVDGACAGGFGGFGGGSGERPTDMGTDLPEGGDRPSGAPDGGTAPADAPTDVPTDMPTDMPGGAGAPGGFGSMTTGLVTAVDSSSITVQTTSQDGTTAEAVVALDGSTTYTTSAAADVSAIVEGLCAQVTGDSDSAGTVAATSVALTEAGDEGCSVRGAGQGMPGGAGGPGGADGSGGPSGAVTPNADN